MPTVERTEVWISHIPERCIALVHRTDELIYPSDITLEEALLAVRRLLKADYDRWAKRMEALALEKAHRPEAEKIETFTYAEYVSPLKKMGEQLGEALKQLDEDRQVDRTSGGE